MLVYGYYVSICFVFLCALEHIRFAHLNTRNLLLLLFFMLFVVLHFKGRMLEYMGWLGRVASMYLYEYMRVGEYVEECER